VIHRPGSQQRNADAVSRRDESRLEAEVSAVKQQAKDTTPPVDEQPIDWPSVQNTDPDVKDVYHLVKSGSPMPAAETITSRSRDAKLLHAQYSRLSVSPQGVATLL